jgi:MFS family permease
MHRSRQPPAKRGLFCWALYDWANSAFPAVIQTFVFASYFARRVAVDQTAGSVQWGVTLGLAGVLVALGGPLLGAVVDQRGRRKPWNALFCSGDVMASLMAGNRVFLERMPQRMNNQRLLPVIQTMQVFELGAGIQDVLSLPLDIGVQLLPPAPESIS